MSEKDLNKLTKAGFATPRGGAKNAYQNHVLRNGRVIIPYEKLGQISIGRYKDGFVIRLYPEQFFEVRGKPKTQFDAVDKTLGEKLEIGKNAFILYRNYDSFEAYPPLADWTVARLEKDGKQIKDRQPGADDVGHYVLRLSPLGPKPKRYDGPPQGLFAPEYADEETNYLSKCVLAWLIVHTEKSPYTTTQADHLKAILAQAGLFDEAQYEFKGIIRHGLTACPLCLRLISYEELHAMVRFEEGVGTDNAAGQVEGSTRSTIVNLFHLVALTYDSMNHIPSNMAWGHAACNTRLGQRICRSVEELKNTGMKVGIILPERVETFGWMSNDWEMIRSPKGAVWIKISRDLDEAVPADPEVDVLSTEVLRDDAIRVELEAAAGDPAPEDEV